MAQYLIIHEDGAIVFVEAKNITAAAKDILEDDKSAMFYRLADPGRRVTARVEQRTHIEVSERIEVSDAGEDQ